MDVYNLEKMPEEQMNEYLTRRHFHGANLTVARFSHKKGGKVEGHVHDYEQLIFVLKGALRCTGSGEVRIVSAGEMLDIPPKTYHEIDAIEDTENITFFSPPREDWKNGGDIYLRHQGER